MPTINQIKQLAEADTPLLFFQCTLPSGVVQHWSTHTVPFAGNTYSARVLKHNLFDLQLSADDAMDGLSKLSLTLANADSALSELNANGGFRGTQVTVYFAFADLPSLTVTSESTVLFRGVAGDPDQIGEDFLQLSFANKLSLQRIPVPEVRIQRSCSWNFPATAAQRQEALDGGSGAKFSRFYRCGYSADVTGGVGNLNGAQPFTACDKSRGQCVERGMFNADSKGNATAHFGGFEFVPSAIQVRTSGDKTTHLSPLIDNTAKYNDAVPIVYGTGWLKSPVVFARNDGNLTHMETLLGLGPIDSVIKVVVEDVEIPFATNGQDMSATGWYSVINSGSREGAFNGDFADSSGNPLGDPHGSIASLSVVVPNRISTGKASPNVEVLVRGIQVDAFGLDGSAQATLFSNNPAWVILDVLRRCGWTLADLNLRSFAASADFCQTLITTTDLSGKQTQAPRYSCNLVLTKRQSAATVIRGIRVASSLMLRYGVSGLLELLPESTLAVQQGAMPDGGNSVEVLNNGWPAYEFSDASAPFSGIARDAQGRSSVVLVSNSVAETSNRLSVEFQDEFNEYQQDSLSIADSGDVGLIGYEIASQSTALGITNYSQATRVLLRQLDKSTKGNLYINFVTSFRALKVRPGDIIAVTYQKEGLARTPFRVTKLSPSMNFQFVTILAQVHDDAWYSDNPATLLGSGRQPATHTQVPRPLLGLIPRKDSQGEVVTFDFAVSEKIQAQADGAATDTLSVGFSVPTGPSLTSLTIPLLSLSPIYSGTGGNLEGGKSYYYAVSAVDQAGGEGALSFTASIHLPAGPNTYAVTIKELSFPATSTGFNVYRGSSPQLLYRIASNVALSDAFPDAGLPILPIGPPDASFDHANFYYRYEYAGPFATTAATASSISSADMGATAAAYTGFTVRISDGMGQGQERSISANTQTTLTIAPPWSILPNSSSTFVIVEASWRFASISDTSPALFEIPYAKRSVIEISGRSANVANQESSAELCPITRWALGNANPDAGLAGPPDFTLGAFGGGNLTLQQVGFAVPANTSSVTSCTLQLFHWNELLTPSPFVLVANLDAAAPAIRLNLAASPYAGQAIQIGAEILTFLSLNADGSYGVSRAALGSAATAHTAGDAVLLLDNSVIVAPFASNFFDNKASANYIHTVRLPDVRIVAAEMFATNALGPSQTTQKSYAFQNPDDALRTLSGGQLSLQVSGYLATQQNASPPLVVEARHAIRDMRATLTEPANGYAISVQILQNGLPYARPLTILSGASSSAAVIKGAALPPLSEGALLTLDIALTLLNPSAIGNSPGRDLTVTIRL